LVSIIFTSVTPRKPFDMTRFALMSCRRSSNGEGGKEG